MLARTDDSFDFKESVKKYSSNDYLNKMFTTSVEVHAQRLFTYVTKSIAQNERVVLKGNFSKRNTSAYLDGLDWNNLIQRWEIKKK